MTVRKGGWLAEKKGLAYIIKEGKMKKKIEWICERLKSGRFKQLWIQTVWIYSYVRMYWKEIVFYTGPGLLGTVIGLVSSLLSKDLVDLITGHQASLDTESDYLYRKICNVFCSGLLL